MLHTLFPHVREISRGKTNNLHSMYPHHLHPNVRVVLGLRFVLQAHPHRVCLMMFVFLGSELCRQLPSDSPSRRTPLLLANGWQLQTPITDFHRQVIRHARHTTKKSKDSILTFQDMSQFDGIICTSLADLWSHPNSIAGAGMGHCRLVFR